jgi:hypothetical protein
MTMAAFPTTARRSRFEAMQQPNLLRHPELVSGSKRDIGRSPGRGCVAWMLKQIQHDGDPSIETIS